MNNTQRITALEAGQARMEALLEQLVAAQTKPAKATRPEAVTRRAVQRTATATPKASTKVLTKTRREAFVKANPAYKGWSTLDIAIAVVHFDAPVKGGWTVHEYLTEKAGKATAAAKRAVKAAL